VERKKGLPEQPFFSSNQIRFSYRLGGGGFEGSLKDVRDLEAALGIGDLAAFTPK